MKVRRVKNGPLPVHQVSANTKAKAKAILGKVEPASMALHRKMSLHLLLNQIILT